MTILFTALGYIYTHFVPFVVLLGILIFVHELGHFLVARMCGIRVEVFSLGFGKKILSYQWGDTVYCISLIPLGGYVKMFGEIGNEQELTEDEKKVAYSHKTPWQRIAVVLAGPLMNFFFAVAVFSGISQVGEETRAAVIASVTSGSTAEAAKLRGGDRVLEVNKIEVKSYEEFQTQLNNSKDKSAKLKLKSADGVVFEVDVMVTSMDNPNIFSLQKKLGKIDGLEPFSNSPHVAVKYGSPAHVAGLRTGDEIKAVNGVNINSWDQFVSLYKSADKDLVVDYERPLVTDSEKPLTTKLMASLPISAIKKSASIAEFGFEKTELYIENVVADSPAEKAGLQKYDRVFAVNSKKVNEWKDISETIRAYDGKEAVELLILRDGTQILKKITPQVTEQNTPFGAIEKRYTIGITPLIYYSEPELVTVKAKSPLHALAKGTKRTLDVSAMTIMSFVRLFQGAVSVKNVGGMISIGKAAKDSFEMGLQQFFMTMGILSVSLFILNLLPIPVLDGGHLVFYTIELIKGSPLTQRKMEIAQQVGMALLLALMILAQFNDIKRFIFKS